MEEEKKIEDELNLEKINKKLERAKSLIFQRENLIIKNKILANLVNAYKHKFNFTVQKQKGIKNLLLNLKKKHRIEAENRNHYINFSILPKIFDKEKFIDKQNKHKIILKEVEQKENLKKKEINKFKAKMKLMKDNLKVTRQKELDIKRKNREKIKEEIQIEKAKKIFNIKKIKIRKNKTMEEIKKYNQLSESLNTELTYWKSQFIAKNKKYEISKREINNYNYNKFQRIRRNHSNLHKHNQNHSIL